MANQPLQHGEQFEIPTLREVEPQVEQTQFGVDVARDAISLAYGIRGERGVLTAERALTPEIETAIFVKKVSDNIFAKREEALHFKKAA